MLLDGCRSWVLTAKLRGDVLERMHRFEAAWCPGSSEVVVGRIRAYGAGIGKIRTAKGQEKRNSCLPGVGIGAECEGLVCNVQARAWFRSKTIAVSMITNYTGHIYSASVVTSRWMQHHLGYYL